LETSFAHEGEVLSGGLLVRLSCLDALQVLPDVNGFLPEEVVIEAVLGAGTDGDLGPGEQALHHAGHDVRGVVAIRSSPSRLLLVKTVSFPLRVSGRDRSSSSSSSLAKERGAGGAPPDVLLDEIRDGWCRPAPASAIRQGA